MKKFGLMTQIKGAAISIPSNIAEGWGRNTSAYYVHFLRISRGSLPELITLLILTQKLELLEDDAIAAIIQECQEIDRMLNAMLQKLTQKR